MPAAAYTCDAEGLITFFNQQAVRLWGREPKLHDPEDRFCGSFRLYASDGTPILHDSCWMALALRDGKPYNGHEIVVERPDGRRVTALAHANPMHDDAGKLLGAVNVLVDITERKCEEDQLRAMDRARNEFLATLAHELRNPLAPIRNAVQVLQIKGPGADELPWALDVIDRQVQQMARLIDDLLDYARLKSNRLQLRREPVPLAEALRLAVETSRPQIDAAHHHLVVSEPPAVEVDGDPTRLAQVISNLLNNAAKYTPYGGTIELSAARLGGDAVITVSDTGAGIAPELLPRVFDMFMQATPPGASGEGLGIGLSLARRLVEMHGGTIEARSEGPGKGSTFTVRLPAIEPQAALPVARLPARSVSAGVCRRILVVDDNRASAGSLRALLRVIGHLVRVAHDGDHALTLARALHPEVLLLDLGLPKVSGYDVARAVRAEDWGKRALLVAMSGWGQETDRARSHEAGFDHHLVKPVDPAALIELLDQGPPPAAGPHPGNGKWEHPEQVQVLQLPLAPRG